MTKYWQPKFNSPANSQSYVDNWDRVFGPKDDSPSEPISALSTPDDEPATTETQDLKSEPVTTSEEACLGSLEQRDGDWLYTCSTCHLTYFADRAVSVDYCCSGPPLDT